jgi:V-type H+-transporting ATPase subunit H
MSYQVGFCFWLLTFDQEIAEQINKYVQLGAL